MATAFARIRIIFLNWKISRALAKRRKARKSYSAAAKAGWRTRAARKPADPLVGAARP